MYSNSISFIPFILLRIYPILLLIMHMSLRFHFGFTSPYKCWNSSPSRAKERNGAFGTSAKPETLLLNRNVEFLSTLLPTRDTRPHRRPPPRQTRVTQEVLPRLQTTGSTHPKTPLPVSSFALWLFLTCGRRRAGISLIPPHIILTSCWLIALRTVQNWADGFGHFLASCGRTTTRWPPSSNFADSRPL